MINCTRPGGAARVQLAKAKHVHSINKTGCTQSVRHEMAAPPATHIHALPLA